MNYKNKFDVNSQSTLFRLSNPFINDGDAAWYRISKTNKNIGRFMLLDHLVTFLRPLVEHVIGKQI